MKKILVVFVVALGVMSCKKVTTKKVDKTIVDGKWRVELFSEDGVNETSHFTNYVFEFFDNGNTTSTNGTTTVTGTWSTDKSSSDDDSNDTHFNLNYSPTDHFDELNDDWHVISLADDKIELEDVSGGDGSIDLLTFVKI